MTTQPDVPGQSPNPGPNPGTDETVPVPPFGATVAGVRRWLPDLTLLQTRPTGPASAALARGVSGADVSAWLEEASAEVALVLDGWTRLPDTPNPSGTTEIVSSSSGTTSTTSTSASTSTSTVELSDRATLRAYAAALVQVGVAAQVEAARNPQRAGDSTSYAASLEARYRERLDALTAWLSRRLSSRIDPSDPDAPVDAEASGLPAARMPAPSFSRGMGF